MNGGITFNQKFDRKSYCDYTNESTAKWRKDNPNHEELTELKSLSTEEYIDSLDLYELTEAEIIKLKKSISSRSNAFQFEPFKRDVVSPTNGSMTQTNTAQKKRPDYSSVLPECDHNNFGVLDINVLGELRVAFLETPTMQCTLALQTATNSQTREFRREKIARWGVKHMKELQTKLPRKYEELNSLTDSKRQKYFAEQYRDLEFAAIKTKLLPDN